MHELSNFMRDFPNGRPTDFELLGRVGHALAMGIASLERVAFRVRSALPEAPVGGWLIGQSRWGLDRQPIVVELGEGLNGLRSALLQPAPSLKFFEQSQGEIELDSVGGTASIRDAWSTDPIVHVQADDVSKLARCPTTWRWDSIERDGRRALAQGDALLCMYADFVFYRHAPRPGGGRG